MDYRLIWTRLPDARRERFRGKQNVSFAVHFIKFAKRFSHSPAGHNPEAFPHDHETVTFVGRPFSLEEAPYHFARLRRWGLTFSELSYNYIFLFVS